MAIYSSCELVLDRQAFAQETGVTFKGLSITRQPVGWRVVLRGEAQSGVALYAVTDCGDPVAGLDRLYRALLGRHGRSLWSRDKFRSGGHR